MEKRVLIASWLFLIGSGLLMIDAISEIVNHFSLMALLHLSEGLLFLVGSIFFMPVSTETPSSVPDQALTSPSRLDLITADSAEA